jgi:DNA-binding NtrC family response regulator
MSGDRKATDRAAGGDPVRRIVLIEDRETTRAMVEETLRRGRWDVRSGGTRAEGEAFLDERLPDLLLTDLQLPDGSGLDLLKRAVARDARLPVIVMSAFGTIEIAVEAMKHGAYDFVPKPFDTKRLVSLIARAVERRALAAADSGRTGEGPADGGIVGVSAAIRETVAQARKVAPSDATVIILGESGTGKELVARAIHEWSGRAGGPLLAVNCAAIPGELMEADFFGSEKGSYTGSTARKLGKVELAQGGTLFLDEIAELPAELQAKLLRVLQERTFTRVGGTKEQQADIRVIAATNRDLEELVRRGRFREDLYYRLAVFPVTVPALRDRPEDVEPIAEALCRRVAARQGRPAPGLTAEALEALRARPWPGNVRELQNAIERAVILADGGEVRAEHVADPSASAVPAPAAASGASLKDVARQAQRRAEEQAIRAALERSGGNKSEAARALGVSYKTLWSKLKEYDLG